VQFQGSRSSWPIPGLKPGADPNDPSDADDGAGATRGLAAPGT